MSAVPTPDAQARANETPDDAPDDGYVYLPELTNQHHFPLTPGQYDPDSDTRAPLIVERGRLGEFSRERLSGVLAYRLGPRRFAVDRCNKWCFYSPREWARRFVQAPPFALHAGEWGVLQDTTYAGMNERKTDAEGTMLGAAPFSGLITPDILTRRLHALAAILGRRGANAAAPAGR